MHEPQLFILQKFKERQKKTYYYQQPGKFGLVGVFTDRELATRLTRKEAEEAKRKPGFKTWEIVDA